MPAVGEHQAFRGFEAQAVDVGAEQQQAGQLHGLGQAELACRLDGIDGVAACIGQAQNLGLGVLGLKQEGREVGGVQRVPDVAQHLAARGIDHAGGVGLQRLAKGVVGRQKEPALATQLHHCLARALGQRHGVIGIVHKIGAALIVGQGRSARAVDDVDLFLLIGHLAHGQTGTGGGAADQHVHALGVEPLARLAGCDIGLVLVVGRQYLDGLAQQLAAKVVHGHLHGQGSALAVHIGIEARHVGDEADANLVLRLSACSGQQASQCQCQCSWGKNGSGANRARLHQSHLLRW